MSITKRMMASGEGLDEQARERAAGERFASIEAFFERTRVYHLEYLKGCYRRKKPAIYRLLFLPHGKPSMTTFYKHVERAGGVSAYLTHYFYCNLKSCLEQIGVPPQEVAVLASSVVGAERYTLSLDEVAPYTPSDEEIERAQDLKPAPRKFRHHSRMVPSILHDKAIHDFFNDVYSKNEAFYQAQPGAVFRMELLDYEDYLQSPFWFLIRNIVLFRDGFKCKAWSAKATAVHHISYDADVLYGKDLEPLVSICEPCHEWIEFDESGNKVSDLDAKRERYEALCKRHGQVS